MSRPPKSSFALLSVLFLAGIVVGGICAFAGSLADVSPNEKIAAFVFGIGMVVAGACGIALIIRGADRPRLTAVNVCVAVEVVSFSLLLIFGP